MSAQSFIKKMLNKGANASRRAARRAETENRRRDFAKSPEGISERESKAALKKEREETRKAAREDLKRRKSEIERVSSSIPRSSAPVAPEREATLVPEINPTLKKLAKLQEASSQVATQPVLENSPWVTGSVGRPMARSLISGRANLRLRPTKNLGKEDTSTLRGKVEKAWNRAATFEPFSKTQQKISNIANTQIDPKSILRKKRKEIREMREPSLEKFKKEQKEFLNPKGSENFTPEMKEKGWVDIAEVSGIEHSEEEIRLWNLVIDPNLTPEQRKANWQTLSEEDKKLLGKNYEEGKWSRRPQSKPLTKEKFKKMIDDEVNQYL